MSASRLTDLALLQEHLSWQDFTGSLLPPEVAVICHAMPEHTEHTAPFAAWQAGWGWDGAGRQAGPVQATAGRQAGCGLEGIPGGRLAHAWRLPSSWDTLLQHLPCPLQVPKDLVAGGPPEACICQCLQAAKSQRQELGPAAGRGCAGGQER